MEPQADQHKEDKRLVQGALNVFDEPVVALEIEEEEPQRQVRFGMGEKSPRPIPPPSIKLGEGEQPKLVHFEEGTTEQPEGSGIDPDDMVESVPNKEPEEIEEDERFRKLDKPKASEDMKDSMKKELAKDKRINLLARAKNYWQGDVESEGWTIQKTVRLFSVITAYLLNLFTVGVIVFEIINIVILFQADILSYFGALKILLEGGFIWLMVKIHEKIEV